MGGLCKTDVREGFHFDATGHWLHLRDPDMRRLADEALPGRLGHRRAQGGDLVARSLHPLSVPGEHARPAARGGGGERARVHRGAARRGRAGRCASASRGTSPSSSCATSARASRGTSCSPTTRSSGRSTRGSCQTAWMGRFVPRPTLEEVVRGALGLEGDRAGYNASFIYPREGGIEAFVRGARGAAAAAGRVRHRRRLPSTPPARRRSSPRARRCAGAGSSPPSRSPSWCGLCGGRAPAGARTPRARSAPRP